MKILSIVIPCYNSAEYMEKAINSVLSVGDTAIEVLIVDDGSGDKTLEIANKYQVQYPNIVRVIHKENGGHGSAINAGLEQAKGYYFKVLDSDDWFDKQGFQKVLSSLRTLIYKGCKPDMVLCNYVYEKPSAGKYKIVSYGNALPEAQVVGWSDIHHLYTSQNFLMHSIIYRTEILWDCQLKLPEHTFYVDNIFAYVPLPHVVNIYYLNADLYRYYIGREGQSVNEAIMIKRIDQQIKVTKILIDAYDMKSIRNKRLQKYMKQYLFVVLGVSSILLIKDGTKESLHKRDELWNYLYNKDKALYTYMKWRRLGRVLMAKSKLGQKMVVYIYRILNSIYNFN